MNTTVGAMAGTSLAACPLCDKNDWVYSQPQFFQVTEEGSQPIGWVTGCSHCIVHVEGYGKADTEAKWNNRPDSKAKEELQAIIGTAQHYQPRGSPPPGGPVSLVSWILRYQFQHIRDLQEAGRSLLEIIDNHGDLIMRSHATEIMTSRRVINEP